MAARDSLPISPGAYFTEEVTAVPFGVLARALSGTIPAPLAYAIAALFRIRGLLRWPLRPTHAVGGPHSGRDVPRQSLPLAAQTRWAAILQRLEELGFRPLKFTIADIIGPKEHVAGVFLDAPGTTLLTLEWMRMPGAGGMEEASPYEFNSYADDDPEIMTGAVRPQDLPLADMLQLDFVDLEVHSNELAVGQVYQRHLARIEGRKFCPMSPEEALREHERRKERRFRWVLDRGLMRRLSDREVETLRANSLSG